MALQDTSVEFGGDPDVLGRTLLVDDVPLTIVGVAPRGFRGTDFGASVDPVSVFVPITVSFSTSDASDPFAATAIPNHDRRDLYWLHLFAPPPAGRYSRRGRCRDESVVSRDPE